MFVPDSSFKPSLMTLGRARSLPYWNGLAYSDKVLQNWAVVLSLIKKFFSIDIDALAYYELASLAKKKKLDNIWQ